MTVIKYLKLPFLFDVIRLREEVAELSMQHWQAHYQQKHYNGNWDGIALRSINGDPQNIYNLPSEFFAYSDTPLLQHARYIREVVDNFKCPLFAIRLLRLSAGSVVNEHRDIDLCYEKDEFRVHIPVITDEAVEFRLDGERLQLREGECWYLNFNLPHSVINNSRKDRIHLVIDGSVNEWLRSVFRSASGPRLTFDMPAVRDAAT